MTHFITSCFRKTYDLRKLLRDTIATFLEHISADIDFLHANKTDLKGCKLVSTKETAQH